MEAREKVKLYTKSDLERAARLAAMSILHEPFANNLDGVEYAVSHALDTVTAEGPPFYDEETVLQLLEYAAVVPYKPQESRRLLEEALRYVRR